MRLDRIRSGCCDQQTRDIGVGITCGSLRRGACGANPNRCAVEGPRAAPLGGKPLVCAAEQQSARPPGPDGTTTHYIAGEAGAQALAPDWRADDFCCPNTTPGCVPLNIRFMLATLIGEQPRSRGSFDGEIGRA